MALLDSCSWAFSDPGRVTEGQIFSFAAAVPPSVPAVLGPDSATASTIQWTITDTAARPLTPGSDYQIVSGGIDQMEIAFVVNPALNKRFNVLPLLTVVSGSGLPAEFSAASGLLAWTTPVTYTPVAITPATLQAKAQALLSNALNLASSATLIEPGATATLQVILQPLSGIPQVVTNLTHELPKIAIRGVIPLGSLVEAIVGPIVGALGEALPSAANDLEAAQGEVAKLLAQPLPIPIGFDVSGRRITRTLAPLTTDLVTTITSDLEDPMNLAGTVPVDNFLASFNLTPNVSAQWSVVDAAGTAVANADLSPGLNLVKTLLLLPSIVPLGALPATRLLPQQVNVSVTLSFDLPQLGLTGPSAVSVTLGPVPLLRLPVAVPHVVVVTIDAFDFMEGGGTKALLSTNAAGAALMPGIDSVKRFLSTLSSALETIAKAAATGGLGSDPAWSDILLLGQGVQYLTTLLARLPHTNIYYQPVRTGTFVDLWGEWNDTISGVIHIGPPATLRGDQWFQLADANGPAFIDFNKNGTTPISIVPNLNGAFAGMMQFPAGTAVANQPGSNLNDILERVNFPSI